ncbi:glucose PTS transporter subunit IIA [Maledivibacter halophilus]|uniref:PTS system, glucose subfamily, IIA component n=1 Tax=Maledivibacter halophilus TaxID=36842 RepID=A0A1T5JIY8_9FIRM|nr:glucose PTS transporter subunit IIA [Maledivibacter halophilus]SKC51123.1 PTS system, glucose subfamily, IIA component [Maledivibacter halophilus]
MTKEKFQELNKKHSNHENKNNSKKLLDLAVNILDAVGGKENIKKIDACITRLRVDVNNINKVDSKRIMILGAQGVFKVQSGIQAVFGIESDQLKDLIKDLIGGNAIKRIKTPHKNQSNITKSIDKNLFVSPLSGKLLDLKDVPDEIFSQKIIGDGFAIEPVSGELVSPVNGKIMTVFPTKHAISIMADSGHEILIHFGIDTVKLKGEGFELLVKSGETVQVGQPILRANLEIIKSKASSIITPIIFTNLSKEETVTFEAGAEVKAGQEEVFII